MPGLAQNGITLTEVVAVVGAVGALYTLFKLTRAAFHFFDRVLVIVDAIVTEFAPNGGRVMSADDAHATTKDILLDIRAAFVEQNDTQKKWNAEHERSAEARAQRLVEAVTKVAETVVRAP